MFFVTTFYKCQERFKDKQRLQTIHQHISRILISEIIEPMNKYLPLKVLLFLLRLICLLGFLWNLKQSVFLLVNNI